jgi:hypothetical protein
MRTNIFTTAAALSDDDLLARTRAFATEEREATAELVAHLAALEMRPSAYAALGHGSLFGYCVEGLGLSEDAACNRIAAARWCRQFPAIADLMASGAVSLTTVRLLGPHLTPENHEAVLARASRRRRADIQALIAELAPQPDVPASVRKVPAPRLAPDVLAFVDSESDPDSRRLWTADAPTTAAAEVPPTPQHGPDSPQQGPARTDMSVQTRTDVSVQTLGPGGEMPAMSSSAPATGGTSAPALRGPRPIVQPSAPGRYRVQFTIGRESHDELRRLQDLLRREIPTGDPGLIFERALHLLLEKVEKAKLGKPGAGKRRAIRSGTDNGTAVKGARSAVVPPREGASGDPAPNVDAEVAEDVPEADPDGGVEGGAFRTEPARSRHIPAAVRAAVWRRDGARCAFVGGSGNRCTERSFLEFHHVQPFALDGPATVGNIALRCRRHNQCEGELDFGARSRHRESEGPAP